MAINTDLLARLRSLDDLLELVQELGYTLCGDELSPSARDRAGLSGTGLGIRRAAILGRRGNTTAYGVVLDDVGRIPVARTVERLARGTAGHQHLLLALDAQASTLAVATLAAEPSGIRARQLRIPLDRPSAVAAEILSGLAPRPGDSSLAAGLRARGALAGEGLTARFFREFTRLHTRAAAAFIGMPRATAAERRDLALVVLTRVLFLYFVQAKQWLAGRSDFLPSLLDTALRSGRPFHRAVFEPLCFAALSAPVGSRSGVARALGDVPFLNGGLFERHALERRFPDAALPDATWRELFDELFDRFHFTVREQADGDAIDPGMLGRVFEGLMAADQRRAGGTYFTPPPLLRRTVARALRASLEGRPPDAALTVRVLDPAAGSGAFLLEALRQLEELRRPLLPDESAVARRRAIMRDNLFGVDVDPMAVRLAELRLWLALVADDPAAWHEVTPLPNLDMNLRQGDSLLSPLDTAGGAPPDVTARVRAVAERRAEYFAATGRRKATLARGIRSDERAIAEVASDAAIRSLTARLADVMSAQGRDLFGRRARDPALARRAADWRRRRRELMAVRRRLAESDALPFFAWETHFGDILASGGFDVIVGNPPWVRGERLPVTARTAMAARYRSFRPLPGIRGFAHLPDLSVAFVERALQLLRPGGALGFVLPAKLLRAGYAGPLRALLRERATILYLEDRSHARTRDFAATVFPLICVARAQPPDPGAAVQVAVVSAHPVAGLTTQAALPVHADHPRSIWLALPGEMTDVIRRVLASGPALASRFRPRLGIKTGANDVFVRPCVRAGELPATHRAPAIHGQDIRPFTVTPSSVMLAALDARGGPCREVPGEITAYLRPHASLLQRRADGRHAKPWALFRTDLLRGRWLVLWRDIAPRLEAVALERPQGRGPIPLNTCYGVIVPDEYSTWWLTAWLNSAPMRILSACLAERASGGAFRFSAATVGALPVPESSAPELPELAEIGRQACHDHQWDTDALDDAAGRALALDPGSIAALRDLGDALR